MATTTFTNMLFPAAIAISAYYAMKIRNDKKTTLPFKSFKGTSKTVMLMRPLNSGYPSEVVGKDFDILNEPIHIGEGGQQLKANEVFVQVLYFSADPYLRGRVKQNNPLAAAAAATTKSGSEIEVKDTATKLRGYVSGKVLASNDPNWQVGDLFGCNLEFSTLQVVNLTKGGAWKLNPYIDESKLSWGIGVLGMPGSTAYGGLTDVLRPNLNKKKGEEILFVSGAAGAVGSLVGQIGKKVFNLKVIGSCGGEKKGKRIVESYGFDHAIDHRTLPKRTGEVGNYDWTLRKEELKKRLKAVAPNGIDMYYDNVGEAHFEAAFESLRGEGRIAICGGIASYNDAVPTKPRIYPGRMIYAFQRIEGFVCRPWLSGKRGNFLKDMSKWLQQGLIQVPETKYDGIAKWPLAFRNLFVNTEQKEGKVVIAISDEDFSDIEVVDA